MHKIDESPLGVGGRVHYNLHPNIAVDAELINYPGNPSGNFGETSLLAGVRVGRRFERLGVFAKLRPGLFHFGGEYFQTRLDFRNHLQFDVGGVIQYYPSARTFVEIDMGDTVIYYGPARYRIGPGITDGLGTVHNFQPRIGFGFRF